jgi:hypothetical protein
MSAPLQMDFWIDTLQFELFEEIVSTPPCGRARCPRRVILEVKPSGAVGRCLVCHCWSRWKSRNAGPR